MWLLSGLLAVSFVAVVALGAAMLTGKRGASPPGILTPTQPPVVAGVPAPRSGVENSASANSLDANQSSLDGVAKELAPPDVPSVPSAHPVTRPATTKPRTPKKSDVLPLEKRGNERYGRFD
jgi:hypothetical protein